MMKGYSFTDYKKFEYQWIIKNFTDYFKFVNETTTYTIISSTFDIDKREKPRFYLKMTFSPQFMSCFLDCVQYEDKLLLTYQLSIVNKKNETFKTLNGNINNRSRKHVTEEKKKEVPKVLEVQTNDLLSRASELFPDDNFKVVCNLTIFENGVSKNLFKIPTHHQSMKCHFKKLLDSQNGSDVVFEVNGKEFNVHKSILMARSPVFLAMFNHDMIEKKSNRVKIEDISPSIFELLMEFIYTDEVTKEVDVETGLDLLRAACKYQLEDLKSLCEVKLCDLLTVNNAMDTLAIAERHDWTDLVEYIKNFVKIYQREIWNIIKPEHFLKHPHHACLFFTSENE